MLQKKKCILLFLCAMFIFGLAEETARPKIGLVLSGGGAKGFAHVGVLKVLEKYGIRPDYITGTSMGSIVGGIYSMGYSAEELDSMVSAQNWTAIFNDNPTREEMAILDKDEFERYSISLDIEKEGLSLPGGLIEGQKIGMLFKKLTSPVYDIRDFSKLPIPYRCVAVDLYTAKKHIFKSGSLADAMRSSMSIPTVFTPVKLDSMLLIDGGVSLNFPVEEVIDMGADVVIGVSVGQDKPDPEEKMDFIDVASQTMFLMSTLESKRQKELCDVFIAPDMEGFTTASFSAEAADSLVIRGERAAKGAIEAIREVAREQKKYTPRFIPEPKPVDSVFVNKIEISGEHILNDEYFFANLSFGEREWVTIKEIEDNIRYFYGTRHFKKIDYDLLPGEYGVTLQLRTHDARQKTFNAGIRYDNFTNASILLNGTFRNAPPFKNSKLLVDGIIGENLKLNLTYYAYSIFNTSITAVGKFNFQESQATEYLGRNEFRITPYTDQALNVGLRRRFWNISYFEISLENEFIAQDDSAGSRYGMLSAATNYVLDNLDDAYYPERGVRIRFGTKNTYAGFVSIHQFQFNAKAAISFIPGLTFIPQFYFGSNIFYNDDFPISRHFYLGGEGVNYYRETYFPFIGLKYNQINGKNAFVMRTDLQIELFDNAFFLMKINIGSARSRLSELTWQEEYYFGYGFSLGTETPIGPIEFTLAGHTRQPDLSAYLRIGYDF